MNLAEGVGSEIACSAGSYCPDESPWDVPCEAGMYCPDTTTAINCTQNDNDGYAISCPAGSTSESLCDPGYYCPTPASQIPCPAGYVCPNNGTLLYSDLCSEGFFYPEGSSEGTECTTSGHYCSEGSSTSDLCDAGYYCPTPAEKRGCEAGLTCDLDVR